MYSMKKAYSDKALYWSIWLLVIIALLMAGTLYRIVTSIDLPPINLPVPLSAFPLEIVDWTGKDVPIAENIQRVAKNDDSLNRLYINKPKNQWANLYIAYSARPRTMLGHRPRVCYVGGGWIHDITKETEVISYSGRKIPCLIHRFHRPAPETRETVVLNFYILNGRLTSSDRDFSGVGIRTPNIAGDPARYVVQVQISSVLENSVRSAAKDMADLILDFSPDKNGKVRAAEYINTASNILK